MPWLMAWVGDVGVPTQPQTLTPSLIHGLSQPSPLCIAPSRGNPSDSSCTSTLSPATYLCNTYKHLTKPAAGMVTWSHRVVPMCCPKTVAGGVRFALRFSLG